MSPGHEAPHGRRTSGDMPPELTRDLRALGDQSAGDAHRPVPPLSDFAPRHRDAVGRRSRPAFPEARPWLAGGALTAAFGLAMLVVPVSYTRTTGRAVALTVGGATEPAQRSAIAGELEALLRVDRVEVSSAGPAAPWIFRASVPARRDVAAERIARAFASTLSARGWPATAVTTPIRERVSGSVYAYARDAVVRVATEGRSPARIEAEVGRRLGDLGIRGARVSVTGEGAGSHAVRLEIPGAPGAGASRGASSVTVELTRDGRAMSDTGAALRPRRQR